MAFPTVTLLDNFNGRSTEKPLSNGGKWTLLNGCTTTGELKNEHWKGTTAFASGEDGAFWNVTEFTSPGVSLELIKNFGSAERYLKLAACLSKANEATKSGYFLKVEEEGAGTGTFKLQLEKCTTGTFANLGTATTALAIAAKDLVGLSVAAGKVIAWHKKGEAGAWEEVKSAADVSFTKGFIGMVNKGNIAEWDLFSGGSGGHKESETLTAKLTSTGKVNKTFSIAKTLTASLTFVHNTLHAVSGALFFGVHLSRTLLAVTTTPKFPLVTLLDSFKRPEENPLVNGGKWASLAKFTSKGAVIEEAWRPNGTLSITAGTYWTPKEFTNPGVSVLVQKLGEYELILFANITKPTETILSGYTLGTFEEAVGERTFTLSRFKEGTNLQFVEVEKIKVAVGDHIGMSVQNGKIFAWLKKGAGAWEVIAEATDANYTKGFVGIGGRSNIAPIGAYTNFEAGDATARLTIMAELGSAGVANRTVTTAVIHKIEAFLLGLRVIDSFQRANENPLNNGGKWASMASRPVGQILEESYQSEGITGKARAYWTPTEFTEPAVAVEMFTAPGEENKGRAFSIAVVAPTPIANENGYLLEITEESVAGKFEWELIREVEGVETQLLKTLKVACAAGDLFGVRVTSGKVQAWHKSGAGAWALIGEGADTTYTKGFIGVGFAGSGGGKTKLRNFEIGSSFAGTALIQRNVLRGLTGILSFVGSISHSVLRGLSATLSPTAALPRNILRKASATLSPEGLAGRDISHAVAGSLSSAGSLRRNSTRTLNASLSFLGALPRNVIRQLTATVSFAGRLRSSFIKVLFANLTFAGTLAHNVLRRIAAALSFLGVLQRSVPRPLTAALTFLGSLRPIGIKSIAATLPSVGNIQRHTTRELAALLTFSTRMFDHIVFLLMASFDFAGTLAKRFELTKRFVASLEFVGVSQRYINLLQTATFDFTGSIGHSSLRRFFATLSSTGTLPRNTMRQASASLNSEASLGKDVSRTIAGTMAFAGSAVSRVKHALSGSVNFNGSFASHTVTRILTATLNFTGRLLPYAINRFEAGLSFAGSAGRRIRYELPAELTLGGFLQLSGKFIMRFAALLDLEEEDEQLSRIITRALSASTALTGSVGQSLVYRLEAALGAVGTLQRAVLHQLAGVLGVSGKTSSATYHQLAASVTFTGTVGRSALRQLRALLESAGSLEPGSKLVQVLTATLSFSGQVARRSIIRTLRAALDLRGFIDFAKGSATKILADTLVLKQEGVPTLTLRHTEAGDVYGLINHLEGYPEMEVQRIVAKRRVFGRPG